MSTTTQTRTELSPGHRQKLEQSGISPEVIAARGYYTETVASELGRLGYSRGQRSAPVMVIPIHDIDGGTPFHQIRPDRPRVVGGRTLKYELPKGSHLLIDVPPG